MEPWEQLDIDESDLDSFIRRCNSNNSVILVPAGVVQAAMLNRQVNENIPTQEFLSIIEKVSFDRDFTSNAWVWAEKFIDIHGLLLKYEVEHISTLDSLKGTCKVSLLRCLIKAREHNGLGDMKITIRDPTGTVKASVHRKAIDHPEIGPNLKVGSVIILQDVAIFSPMRRTYYLNITLNNVVKVFASDIGRPTDELVRLSIPIVTKKLPSRSVDDILSMLTPPVDNDKPEGSRANNNN
ncbi:uncharacterized protein C17orf53 homolog [Vigna radiata var. radiata]|uniref:Uncharacterized protein C17orf53 homolog n=1 Tax=Vigna radiata var. radiata TaxID=3916 RepID=A0A1S3W2R3_VIGRR|nr:uncharacterized protein C17orf53 homolog [Vigna radiata var. radiata]